MPNLNTDFCGIKSPNPFWLASAPPTNSGSQIMRAFDQGWGGAVWKTLGKPIINVSSRFGAIKYSNKAIMGLNNIELITDRPLNVNFKEIHEVKKRFPKNALIVSLMAESKKEWQEIITRSQDAGADGLELNFSCPHGMCEQGMGSAVGQEPKILKEITSWVTDLAKKPVIIKLTPNVSDINIPAQAAINGGAHGISLINTIKSIVGVDLNLMIPQPVVGDASTNGGYSGPAVKPIALHMVGQLARNKNINVPISGIGGISNWRDAAEFIALGSSCVQICTAVMKHGYRIIGNMIDGLNDFLTKKGLKSVKELIGQAVPSYKEWKDLDLNHHTVAKINPKKCIGCQLCYIACLDGAHQCIFLPTINADSAKAVGHNIIPTKLLTEKNKDPIPSRIPWVYESECVGCNLCQYVCPVEDCIKMELKRKNSIRQSLTQLKT